MRVTAGALVALLTVFPVGAAEIPPADDGTASDPETVDGAGDVRYDAAHVGEKNHDYLDVTAAWMEYVPAKDRFNFTIQVVSTLGLADAPLDYQIGCGAGALGFVGTEWTEQEISWSIFKQPQQSTYQGYTASWRQGSNQGSPINGTFDVSMGSPGFFNWSSERSGVQGIGEEIGAWVVECYESWFPQGITRASSNDDAARSTATFPVGAYDPPSKSEDDSVGVARRPARSSTDEKGTESAAVGSLGVIAAVVVGVSLARRR